MSEYRQAAFAFILLAWVAIIASQLGGCEHGSLIPIDGVDVDVCAIEGVEECAPECDEGSAYRRGYSDALGNCPDTVIIETEGDTCDLSVPVGHRPIECRGKPISQRCETQCITRQGGRIDCRTVCYDERGRRV